VSEDLYPRLTTVFANVFDDDDIVITPELTANDVDEWDSLKHIRLIIAIEQEFGLKFATSEVNDFKNVGELVDVIAAKTSG